MLYSVKLDESGVTTNSNVGVGPLPLYTTLKLPTPPLIYKPPYSLNATVVPNIAADILHVCLVLPVASVAIIVKSIADKSAAV